jgi:uncharacterized protein YjiS (DUF1127 family)
MCRPSRQKCPSFTSNRSEYPMLNSQSAIVAVRRYSPPGLASRAAPHDRCDNSPEQLTPTTDISEARPATGQADAIWQSVLWFCLEGFAVYGASFHGLATNAVTTITSEVGAQRPQVLPRRERRKSISLVSSSACAEITVLEREDAIDRRAFGTRMPSTTDGFASPARQVDRYRLVPPGWLAMIWRAIASRWAKWRREGEVKKAVAALAQYDDRTLRDMGIPHRSQIEQIVRDGRDY